MEDTALSGNCHRRDGSHSARRSKCAGFWNNIKAGATASARSRRTAGIRHSITIPTTALPTRRTRRSAAGFVSIPGIPSSGGWPFRRAWRMPWTARSAGRSPARAKRWPITAIPKRPLNTERTAVILGNAMAGEKHYLTSLRAFFPEYARELDAERSPSPRCPRPCDAISRASGMLASAAACLRSPKTACPANWPTAWPAESPISSISAARTSPATPRALPPWRPSAPRPRAWSQHDFDVALTGGIDRNMGASTFIKFCKIGALSGTGSRPYAEGADGFVMGEGAALFLIKRLEDAERDGDKIYAVIRGIGASSDGKGKGITAPNPAGQKLAVERAWQNAGLSPATATLIEGHGTSTSVGDVVEVESIAAVLKESGATAAPIALGSVKSNIGHLKGAAGAAGMLKTALALRDKVLPPSVHCEHPNPNIDFAHSPLYVNTELRPWTETAEGVRRAGVSAFGFGGTNFHVVMEEYIPHRLTETASIGAALRCRRSKSPDARAAASLCSRQGAFAWSPGDRRRLGSGAG